MRLEINYQFRLRPKGDNFKKFVETFISLLPVVIVVVVVVAVVV